MVIADNEQQLFRKMECFHSQLEFRKATLKRRQRAILLMMHKSKRLESRRQAFYVRSVSCFARHLHNAIMR